MVHVIAYDEMRTELMCVAVNFTLAMPEAAAAAAGPGAARSGGAAGDVQRARAAFADIRQLVAGGEQQREQEVERTFRRRMI
jgi:hypothetical protein